MRSTERGMLKFSPLFDWTREEVLVCAFEQMPVNRLHAKWFASIGCAPAPAQSHRENLNEPDAGGGSRKTRRNVVCMRGKQKNDEPLYCRVCIVSHILRRCRSNDIVR